MRATRQVQRGRVNDPGYPVISRLRGLMRSLDRFAAGMPVSTDMTRTLASGGVPVTFGCSVSLSAPRLTSVEELVAH